ncbi:Uncharacterised protein [Burkholderia pseudomallei]|nr:Uncharacterised protein [Burkholderia pseudomallei]CAJ8051939.1 Uncharacterised protein [Burkholderia pseudomallei]
MCASPTHTPIGALFDSWRGRRTLGHCQHLVPVSVTSTMCSHCADSAAVTALHTPPIRHGADVAPSGIDHGLDGEDHPWLQLLARARTAVVQDLRLIMKHGADSVSAVFTRNAITVRLCVFLDYVTNVSDERARTYLSDFEPHALVRYLNESSHENRAQTYDEHAARISKMAVLDNRKVNVEGCVVQSAVRLHKGYLHHARSRSAATYSTPRLLCCSHVRSSVQASETT